LLVLTRNPPQKIVIGNDITVALLGVNSKAARIGVDAPRDYKVHRLEVYERLHRSQTNEKLALITMDGDTYRVLYRWHSEGYSVLEVTLEALPVCKFTRIVLPPYS